MTGNIQDPNDPRPDPPLPPQQGEDDGGSESESETFANIDPDGGDTFANIEPDP